jgi:hypothetical protein
MRLDGELVAYGRDGRPDFHRLSARMLHGEQSVAVTYAIFDVLAVEGLAAAAQPYAQPRRCLRRSTSSGRVCSSSRRSTGPALFDAIVALELGGDVSALPERPVRKPLAASTITPWRQVFTLAAQGVARAARRRTGRFGRRVFLSAAPAPTPPHKLSRLLRRSCRCGYPHCAASLPPAVRPICSR